MARFVSILGQVFGSLKVIEDNGGCKIKLACLNCGDITEKIKGNIVRGTSTRCKKCQKNSSIKNKLGETFGSMQVVKDSGDNQVVLKCINCGNLETRVKHILVARGVARCSECYKGSFINRVGELFGDIEVTKELGNDKVETKCHKCGGIKVVGKAELVRRRKIFIEKGGCSICSMRVGRPTKSIIGNVYKDLKVIEEPVGRPTKSIIGNVYKDLKVIEEPVGRKVKVQCQKCGLMQEKFKQAVIEHRVCCSNCNKKEKVNSDYIIGNFKVLEKLGGRKLKVRCIVCGYVAEKFEQSINAQTARCTNCKELERLKR